MTDQDTDVNDFLLEQYSQKVQHNESQLHNLESVQKIIHRYYTKIQQLIRIIKCQKKNNEHLKQQLKMLNLNLNSIMEKVSLKTKKEDHVKDQVYQRKLENQIKINVNLKKEVEGLRVRVKMFEGQKIADLFNEIKQKDRVIEDLQNTIKMHEKMEKKEMNMDIYKKEEEAKAKVNSLNEEIIHLKKKINDHKKHEEEQERSIKYQHEKINSIEDKYKNDKRKKDDKPKETYELLEMESKRLRDNFEASENSRKNIEKSTKVEIDTLKYKNKLLQKEISEIKAQKARKQKQIISLNMRFKQIQRATLTEYSSKQDKIEKQKQEDQFYGLIGPDIHDCRRQVKGLMHLNGIIRKFDDSESMPEQKNYKMRRIMCKYSEDHIVEMEVEYDTNTIDKNSSKREKKNTFWIESHYSHLKTAELVLSDYEYIKQLEIYCGKCVEFIRMKTSKQKILEVGNEKVVTKSKRYAFDIKTYEKPISFFGVIQKKINGEHQRQVLISLGLIMKRKDIFNKSKSVSKFEKRRGGLSLLKISNDKNYP